MTRPNIEPPRRANFTFYFFCLIVGCAIIGGLALLLLNMHDDMAYMVQLDESDDARLSNNILVDSTQQPVKVKRWCSICMLPLNQINNTTRQLECGHEFHKDCIEVQGTCPICKIMNNSREPDR